MGKEQKIHNFNRLIAEPFFLFLALAGLLIGFNIGFSLFNLLIFVPLTFLLLLLKSVRDKGKIGIITLAVSLLIGFSLGIPKTKARTDFGIYEGIVIENRSNYFIFDSGFHRYYVYEKECEREEGDYLSIEGSAEPLKFTTYEGYFDFEDYLNKKGVDSELKAKSIEVKWERPLRFAARENAFLGEIKDPLSRGLVSSVLFGDKDYSNEAISIASSMNALNFLSISGILVEALLGFFEWFFHLGFKEKKTNTFVLVISAFLIPLGFHKVGFWRVFIGRAINYFCLMTDSTIDPLAKSSISGLILFLFNPYNALNSAYLIGFGLSFFMTLTKPFRSTYERFDRKAIDLIVLYIFLSPLFIKGNEFHILGPFYSGLLLPFVYPLGVIALVSFITLPSLTALRLYCQFFLGFLKFLESFDYTIPFGNFSETAMIIYYVILILFFMFWDKGLTHFAMRVATLGVTALLINILPFINYAVDQVTFINVGQGDSILIRNNDKTLLIDVGGNTSFDLAKEVTIPFLRKEKVFRLDYVIITHYDSDHSGALDSLRSNFYVKHIVDNPDQFPLKIGDLTINNLNPGIPNSKEENDNSLVLHMNFMKKSWLLMGDAPIKVEKNILKEHPDIDCDILKVGHHGSNTSTCAEFLEKVTPEEAIISVGKKNKYGHPSDSVQARLDRYGVRVRRTDIEGSITYRKIFGFL